MYSNAQLKLKYCLDKAAAILLILMTCPIWIVITVVIKLEDSGPIFFRQQRLGINGKAFTILKFRSMIVNADKHLRQDGSSANVNRITRVGKVLRRTSTDELPQLLNVLLGEMSFVGPRPALVSHLNRYTDFQKLRLSVLPGLTGLAQIKGRNTLRWTKRIKYDVFYIRHYSLLLDFKIMLATASYLVTGQGIVLDRNPSDVDDLRQP